MIAVASLFVLTSCGKVLSQPSQINNDSIISTSEVTQYPWDCETDQDNWTFCSKNIQKSNGQSFVFQLACSPNEITYNFIYGYNGYDMFPWQESENATARVRIDSGQVEDWNLGFAADALGISFDLVQDNNKDSMKNKSSWELLERIASAKTLEFEAKDAYGNIQTAEFEVGNSVPIAAKFSSLGCHG